MSEKTPKEFLALPIEERRRLMKEAAERAAECEKCSIPDCTWCPNDNPNKNQPKPVQPTEIDRNYKYQPDTVLTRDECKVINSAMPSDAKYGDVFEEIAKQQDAHTRHSIARELKRITTFGEDVGGHKTACIKREDFDRLIERLEA